MHPASLGLTSTEGSIEVYRAIERSILSSKGASTYRMLRISMRRLLRSL